MSGEMPPDRFQRSCATFDAQRGELLEAHPGRIAVVLEDRLIGIVDDYEAGIELGARAAGGPGFLVAEIRADDPVALPALYLR